MKPAFTLCCLFVLCLAVTGCAAIPAPMGHQSVTPAVESEFFLTRDGLKLPLRHWDAEVTPRAIIIALHGMSDYSNAFDMPARQWVPLGITTVALDQRGFGAGPNPGLWAGSAAMRADLGDLVQATKRRYPGVAIFALGESMGGGVLLSALAESQLDVSGAILVAPAVWSRRDMPIVYRVALFLVAHLLPGMDLSNNAASRVATIVPSDNIPMLRALSRDPLFQKHTRADALFGLVNLMDEARNAPQKITQAPPILLLTGAKDQVIPHAPTEAVITELGTKGEVRHYANGYHMLLRDLEGPLVNQDVAQWVLSKVPARQPN